MKQDIKLELNIPDDMSGLELFAGKRKMKQILFNLLSNAVKFTPEGGNVSISVGISCGASLLASGQGYLFEVFCWGEPQIIFIGGRYEAGTI